MASKVSKALQIPTLQMATCHIMVGLSKIPKPKLISLSIIMPESRGFIYGKKTDISAVFSRKLLTIHPSTMKAAL